MPTVQYVSAKGVRITKTIATPKRLEDLTVWWKVCRKAVPEIPDVPDGQHRFVQAFPDVSLEYIRWKIEDTEGFTSYVIIDRKRTMT